MSDFLQLHGLHGPWYSPGQNTGVGSLFLLQWIFPTQGFNPCLSYCRWILYQLSYQGRIVMKVKWINIYKTLFFYNIILLLLSHFSVRPHRLQPTRLPRPWDSPGKNTGVGCHFLLQCMKVKSESEVSQLYLTLSDLMDCSLPGSYIHGIFQARVLEWAAIAFSL